VRKEKCWKNILEANPEIEDGTVVTRDNVRRLFDIVWNTAYASGAQDMLDRMAEIGAAPRQRKRRA
jgi:hypothetical protein